MALSEAKKVADLEMVVTLRRLPLFTDLSEEQLAAVAARATAKHYPAGEMIFSEGDSCRELFVVQEGRVRIFKTAANGREQLIGIERTGNSLSEIPVFDGDCYPVSAQALTATVLLRLDGQTFRSICLRQPDVAMKVIKVLAHRLRRMGSLVEDLSFVTVRGRLIAYLLHLADNMGRQTPAGVEFELLENNEELAARLGTVRELVSRNLGRLHNEGLIQIKRRTIEVPDLNPLRQEIARQR
jgi:CRP-like cAMP-binding protein